MAKSIYLLSGHTSSGSLEDIDRDILADLDNKNVLVLNLSWAEKKKLKKKRVFFNEYFRNLGASNVEFVFEETPDSEKAFNNAGLLYLPGGDTLTLLENIRKKDLVGLISSFENVISGNSAGAYSLCPEYLRLRDNETGIYPALSIVDFWVKAHYDTKFDPALKELSKNKEIYALKNSSAVVCSENLSFIGEIWKFSEGKKERIN